MLHRRTTLFTPPAAATLQSSQLPRIGSRVKVQDLVKQAARDEERERAQDAVQKLVYGLAKAKATVLVVCSQHHWVALLDILFDIGFHEAEILEHVTRHHQHSARRRRRSMDEDTHPANVESLLVALFGKGRLTDVEDGGSHSKTAPYLLNPSMRSLLAPDPELRPLSKSYHRWSLDASGGAHGFETERRHLVRTVPLLLGRALKPGELDCCPAFENLLLASVTDVIAKGKYTEARHHSRDQAVEEKRVETRQQAHQVGMELLAKLEGQPSVLVVCSSEVQLVLRDCLAKAGPPSAAAERLWSERQPDGFQRHQPEGSAPQRHPLLSWSPALPPAGHKLDQGQASVAPCDRMRQEREKFEMERAERQRARVEDEAAAGAHEAARRKRIEEERRGCSSTQAREKAVAAPVWYLLNYTSQRNRQPQETRSRGNCTPKVEQRVA